VPHHASFLRTLLLATAVPALGCGGQTEDVPPLSGGSGGSAGSGGVGGSAGAGQGGAGGSAAGSGGAGGAAGGSQVPCDAPKPVLAAGKPTGYVTCANGAVVRREVTECPSQLPRPEVCPNAAATGCQKDSDCTAKPNGYCGVISWFGGEPPGAGCECIYGCTEDADCGEGSICLCGEPVGRCAPATCVSDAACPEGGCSLYESMPGCPSIHFACQLLADECASNQECEAKNQDKPFCTIKEGKRVCSSWECAAGRPLRVEEDARFAPLVGRSDW
jgi:hypothetical protein